MTGNTATSRQELVEQAALDALGLLDEIEAAAYSRAFLNAPETVQQELRELQAQVASHGSLLTEDKPDATLRQRVLIAVNSAIAEEDEKLAPLASIGKRLARAEAAGDMEPRYRLLIAARFWRAACFMLCGALIVMMFFWSRQNQQANELGKLALSNKTVEQIEEMIGPTFKNYLFDNHVVAIHFQPNNPTLDVDAVLMIKEDGTAMLVTEGLTDTELPEYTLTMIDRRGNRQEIAAFDNQGRLDGRAVTVDYQLASTSSWEVRGPDGLVLTSVV